MAEKVDWDKIKKGWSVYDHEIYGVTADMIDWWWVNMEKGYPLWHPEDHHSFVWEVPPGIDTHLGAVQAAVQGRPGAIRTVRPRWWDPNLLPEAIKEGIIYEHVLVGATIGPDNKPGRYIMHQYEATSYGVRHRFSVHPLEPSEPRPAQPAGTGLSHPDAEAKRWEEFLPQLYKMWQAVKDPTINRQCCCKTKREASTIKYVR